MQLNTFILKDLQNIAEKYNLSKLILFGSRARNTSHDRSDIDIAAYFKDSTQYFDFCDDIENIRTLLSFDVINLSSDLISLDLRKNIQEEGVIIYEKI